MLNNFKRTLILLSLLLTAGLSYAQENSGKAAAKAEFVRRDKPR
jgi:hypothetical protein